MAWEVFISYAAIILFFLFVVQQFRHDKSIDGFCLLFAQAAQAHSLPLIRGQQLQGHQIAHFIVQRQDHTVIPAFPGDDLGLDKAGTADLTVEPVDCIFRIMYT